MIVPQPLPRYVDDALERVAWERKLARILMETGEPMPKTLKGRRGKMIGFRSAEDDLARLRVPPGLGRAARGTPHR